MLWGLDLRGLGCRVWGGLDGSGFRIWCLAGSGFAVLDVGILPPMHMEKSVQHEMDT